jgi:hypothetical protein
VCQAPVNQRLCPKTQAALIILNFFEYRSRINICEVIREHVLSRFAWLYPLKPHNLPAGLGGHVHKIFETFEERVKTKRPKDHYEPESERDRL